MNYSELVYQPRKQVCSLQYMSWRELIWELTTGVKIADRWPKDVTFQMRPDRPKDTMLADHIPSWEPRIVASLKLQEFFKNQNLPDLEYLPITILDHKGKVAASDYALIHCCHVVDCIDPEKSKDVKWDRHHADKTTMTVEEVVLNESALGPDDRMVVPKYLPGKVFYREDLVEAIEAAGFPTVTFSREIFGDY